MATVQDRLNTASPGDLPDRFRQLTLGDLIAGLIPSERTLSGLTSSATHIHDIPGLIVGVALGAVPKAIVLSADTAGAGEVKVTYDSDGLATLVFGDGANTAYTVVATQLPAGLGATLATVA